MSGAEAEIKVGNCLPLSEIPVGTQIHNIELYPGKGGQLVRSAGNAAQLMAKEGKYATLRLPSGEMRLVLAKCRATIGTIGNADHENVKIGKAGRKGREILLGFEKRVNGKRVYKSKEELLSQARKLQSFIKSDVYSDTSYTQLDEKAERARQTFNERFGYDLSESEYYNWVENMGTIGADAKGTFSYVTAGAAYAEARRSGVKVNLADIVERATKKSKGRGWDKQRMTDEILEGIKKEVKSKASEKDYKKFMENTGLVD